MNSRKWMHLGLRAVIFLGLMIALNVVFTRLLAVNIFLGGSVRLSLSFLPIVITSIVYGPWVGALGAAAADLVGMLILPTGGPYFPGFTLNQALFGFLYGLFFQRGGITWLRTLLAFLAPGITVGVLLKSLWLSIILSTPYLTLLPLSALNAALLLPIQMVLVLAMRPVILRMKEQARRIPDATT